ncbi:MAG: hypothetical protein LBQ06_05145, partial [Frankiaceae bacterium]|nr:hypothetical protein [Frankiaceae bacterium]
MMVWGLAAVPSAAAADAVLKISGGLAPGYEGPVDSGSPVSFTYSLACSSLVADCGPMTFTDVLDPRLDYTNVSPSTGPEPLLTPSWDSDAHTLTITADHFPAGVSATIVLNVRVKPGVTCEPNNLISNQP